MNTHNTYNGSTRVLHLIETGGPGGAERMMLDLARNLGPGYQSIVGLAKPGWLLSQIQSLGIPHSIIWGNRPRDIGVIRRIIQVVRKEQIGLVHTHEFYMNFIGAIVSCITHIPQIATVHGKNYYPERLRRRALYRLAVAHASRTVAVSKDLRTFFCSLTGVPERRIEVVYNGIDCRRLYTLTRDPARLSAADIPPSATVIGTLGNLYPVKGHRYLIQAARTIIARQPNAHFIFLGRGELERSMCQEAEALGIAGHIHLLGFRDDAQQWLGCMDVFALPSLSEGMPLSILEAMAAGIPVVSTRVGGIPELVTDGLTGFMVSPGNPTELARKILFLLENPSVARAIGVAGQRQVHSHYTSTHMVQNYTRLYDDARVSSRCSRSH